MTYTKQTWANGSAGATPINADRLNHIEVGIDAASNYLNVSSSPYNVVADGTNQSSGLQAAHDALPATGGVLWFDGSVGTYVGSINVTKNITLKGANRRTVTIKPASTNNLINLSGTGFGSGGDANITIENMTILGNGAGSQILDTSGLVAGGGAFAEGSFIIRNCAVRDFPATALHFGTSVYFFECDNVHFLRNVGSVYAGKFADGVIHNCRFVSPQTVASVTVIGPTVQIHNCWFYGGDNLLGTPPDILYTTLDGGENGSSFVSECKFGPEGEVAGRVRIQIQGSSANYVIPNISIHDNNFFGIAGQTAIRVNNPVRCLSITDNVFDSYSTIVNDIQTFAGSTHHGYGKFVNNEITEDQSSLTLPTVLFTNGGRDFSTIRTRGAKESRATTEYIPREAPELRNRLTQSQTLQHADWLKGGVTITAGQTDPFGTATAQLLTRSNATGSENIRQIIGSLSGLKASDGSAASGNNGRLFLSLYGKAGTLSSLVVGIEDFQLSAFVALQTIQLPADWGNRISIPITGIDPAHGNTLIIYPGSTAQMAGTLYLCGLQLSDNESDYFPTVTTALSTATAGTRFSKEVQFGYHLAATGGSTPAISTANGSSVMSVVGDDTSGRIIFTTNAALVAGNAAVQIDWARAFPTIPNPVISPMTRATKQAGVYISSTTTTNMTIALDVPPGVGTVMEMTYFNIRSAT